MFENTSPLERLRDIGSDLDKWREPDHINEYLKEEEYIVVIDEKNKKSKYRLTENGKKIIEKLIKN